MCEYYESVPIKIKIGLDLFLCVVGAYFGVCAEQTYLADEQKHRFTMCCIVQEFCMRAFNTVSAVNVGTILT